MIRKISSGRRRPGDRAQRAQWIGARQAEAAARAVGHRFGQDKGTEEQVGQRHRGGGIKRCAGVDARKQPADQWAKHEADAKARADQAEAAATILGRRDVGDIGGGGGLGGRGDAGDDAGGQQQPDGGRRCQHQIIQRHHRKRDQQHRAAAVTVRQRADDRAEQELHHRERGGEDAAPDRRL